jgi:hypothetical protein
MENKTCTKCSQTKPLNEFRRDNSTKTGYRQPCQNCNSNRSVAWQISSADKAQQWRFRKTKMEKKLRTEVLESYGNCCVCCNEKEPMFLSVDHIYNDGAKHRQEIGNFLYRWLKKNGFPKDRFQLLCHNCNFAKGIYGHCPHQK